MARKRFIVPWTGSEEKPAIYHCVLRVVDRRFALDQKDKEQFRMFMRMYEKFTGCRVLTYCIMCNHVHLLLEVTPWPPKPLLYASVDGIRSSRLIAFSTARRAWVSARSASGRLVSPAREASLNTLRARSAISSDAERNRSMMSSKSAMVRAQPPFLPARRRSSILNQRLRIRIDLGVTSTSSSSPIHSMAVSSV